MRWSPPRLNDTGGKMFRWIVLVTCVFAVAIGLAIGVMNPEPVVVNLPGLTFSLPLGSLLMLVFALGLVLRPARLSDVVPPAVSPASESSPVCQRRSASRTECLS